MKRCTKKGSIEASDHFVIEDHDIQSHAEFIKIEHHNETDLNNALKTTESQREFLGSKARKTTSKGSKQRI